MGRMHLIELEDQKWFPEHIRNGMTDLLNFQITFFQIYDVIVPILHGALIKTNTSKILDLCSGGAGPSRRIQKLLATYHHYEVKLTLSDLYPNNHALLKTNALNDPHIEYLPSAIDAMKVPTHFDDFRTLFTSFHHFAPKDAQALLRDATKSERGIAIFELSERSLAGVLLVLVSFLLTFVLTPFLRPFCWQRLFYTYVIPVIPLSYLFDGLVSQVRSYTPKELLALAKEIKADYTWEAGRVRHHLLPIGISYLVGYKRPQLTP